MHLSDTIAAIATAPGEGAISIIRLSGPQALEMAGRVFSGPVSSYPSHTLHYGKIFSSQNEVIDTVLLAVMRAPRSYTGEESIEIYGHGGSLVTRKVLERLFEVGARPAEPGEFSLRAFLNGKIDLAQAEAVQQLIHAKSELALSAAEKQLSGSLSKKIGEIQKELLDIGAILEAWVDFPEEGLAFASFEEIIGSLEKICGKMEALSSTFHDGKLLHEGFSLCLVGTPNVGKSSLMNALLGKPRAIVTPLAGTTRDLLEEPIRLKNLFFRLIDTAGIRKTDEIVEQEGIRRSHAAMQEADIVLLLLDASRPLNEDDLHLLDKAPRSKTVIAWNKIDIASTPPSSDLSSLFLSAEQGLGLSSLVETIEKRLWKHGAPSKEEVVITQERHFHALHEALSSCKKVIDGLQSGISAELVSSDLKAALSSLSTILGTNVTEDLLSAIFSKFCLGK